MTSRLRWMNGVEGATIPLIIGIVNVTFPRSEWAVLLWPVTIVSGLIWSKSASLLFVFISNLLIAAWAVLIGGYSSSIEHGHSVFLNAVIAITSMAVSMLVCFYIDRLKKINSELQEQANRDSLTGLLNRRLVNFLFGQEFARTRRYDHDFCVIMLDIDKFKNINDQHGHLIGDQILKNLSELLRHSLRSTDLGFRLGGDEFSILLPETTFPEAQSMAETLRIDLANLNFAHTKLPNYTVSFGVTQCQLEDTSFEVVIDRADRALYEAKQLGGNRTRVVS